MAKNPILPLYYNDITTSTQDWTDEEFGAYMRLLIHQWRQGGLPKDYQRLTRIATSLATNWPMLQSKFVEVDGLLKNPVMESIREKKAKHAEKQSENVRKRYQTSTKPYTKNLPLEEENEIEKEIEKKVRVQGEDEEYDQVLERWTKSALDGDDAELAQMEAHEAKESGIPWPPGFSRSVAILDHRDLSRRYDWRFETQKNFRYSLMKVMRDIRDKKSKYSNEPTKRTSANAITEPAPGGFGKL